MKFYIAGKVTGLSNYREVFQAAEDKLIKKGHVCMNPAVLGEGFPWEVYMPICYTMIDACEAIFLLKNWKDSTGAKIEYEYALKKGLKIFFEE